MNVHLIRANEDDTIITSRCMSSARPQRVVVLGYVNNFHYVSSEGQAHSTTYTNLHNVTYEIESSDDGDRSMLNISDHHLRAMDEIIVNTSSATISCMLDEMKPLLMQVISRERPNWRHDVVRRTKYCRYKRMQGDASPSDLDEL